MYEFVSRIRYSECDSDAHLTPVALVNYFQDCCVFHSMHVGRGPKVLKQNHYGWYLTAWQIIINRYPTLGELVTVRTQAYRFHAMEGNRNLLMRGVDGELLAYADSRWAFMDTELVRPIRVPGEEAVAYEVDEEFPFPVDKMPRHIKVPKEGLLEYPAIPVSLGDIDTNHHVNNESYIGMAATALPEDLTVREIRVEYLRQAHLGDTLVPYVWEEESEEEKRFIGVEMRLDGAPCCRMRFTMI